MHDSTSAKPAFVATPSAAARAAMRPGRSGAGATQRSSSRWQRSRTPIATSHVPTAATSPAATSAAAAIQTGSVPPPSPARRRATAAPASA